MMTVRDDQKVSATLRRTALPLVISGLLFSALSLACPAPTLAQQLAVERTSSNVVLRFSGRLQTALRVEGPYTNVPGASTPYAAQTTDAPQQFWRTALDGVQAVAAGDTHSVA